MTEEAVPKFKIKVQLTGLDSNAMVLIATVRRALRKGGATPAQLDEFVNEATSGDFDHVLTTCMDWVEVR